MKTPKFAGPMFKKKRVKKTHITKKEYRRLKADIVDKSLDAFFKGA